MLPALAATLLQRHGHEAVWLDGIAEGWDWETYCREVERARPDLMMIETKTPSAPPLYEAISDLKARFPTMTIALVGDHVTAFPEEPFLFCPVDYVIRGGQFDFALLNLADFLEGRDDLGGGVFWRHDETEIVNSGTEPNPPVREAVRPHIDRRLAKWELYAYRNGNFLEEGDLWLGHGRQQRRLLVAAANPRRPAARRRGLHVLLLDQHAPNLVGQAG